MIKLVRLLFPCQKTGFSEIYQSSWQTWKAPILLEHLRHCSFSFPLPWLHLHNLVLLFQQTRYSLTRSPKLFISTIHTATQDPGPQFLWTLRTQVCSGQMYNGGPPDQMCNGRPSAVKYAPFLEINGADWLMNEILKSVEMGDRVVLKRAVYDMQMIYGVSQAIKWLAKPRNKSKDHPVFERRRCMVFSNRWKERECWK